MPKLPVLLTKLDDDIPDVSDVSARLRRHLMRLRGHEIGKSDLEAFHIAMDAITGDELARLRERAQAYVERARAASGTAHLKREEKQRLAAVKDGVRAMTVATEARADEIAADIHARMPWMAPATEAAWHAMRRCAQSGAPVLPELLVTDGASHFKSEAFRQVCADLGIATEIATNGKPETRGTVERVFKTVASSLMPRLSGRTFSDIITKGDTDPRDRAALTLDDLTFALIRWVVDIYHNTEHRGLAGETPLECWRRLTKQYGVQPPPDIEHTRLVFGARDTRRLDKTGVTVLGVRYHSDVLAKWMLRRDPETVEVRWHPMDIGAVSVCLGSEWHTIPAVDDSLDGVPARTWLTAVRHVRAGAPKSKRADMVAVREAIKAIDARNAASMAAAGLNVEDWSPEAVAREERKPSPGSNSSSARPRKRPTPNRGMPSPICRR